MRNNITPIEKHGNIWVKRDDLFEVAGVHGGKARSCWHLAQGARGLITAGARQSPQGIIVASIAQHLNIPCQVHTPSGALTPELQLAQDKGAEIVQHKPGYNTVIIRRAIDNAQALGWQYIPFGMECQEAVTQTRGQVANIPTDVKRIVAPVGSGISLAGILLGLQGAGLWTIPVLGICVGANPIPRLDRYSELFWRSHVTLLKAPQEYHKPYYPNTLDGITVDPYYEAKCLPYLQDGDLFWIVGIRPR